MHADGGGGGGSAGRDAHDYGDVFYWDARYLEEGAASFDWYQRYSALRPFVSMFVPTSSRVLMAGCGNAMMSEDMVQDGYVDIVNIDISSIVIELMRKKNAHIPHLTYMQMDVRNMGFFHDGSFDCVIDKGTLDSLMCGSDAPLSATQMVEEVSRLLKAGGIFMLITYGDPSVRIPHLNQPGCSWEIILYIIPRPGYQSCAGFTDAVPLTERGLLPPGFVLNDPNSHYIYVCKKMH